MPKFLDNIIGVVANPRTHTVAVTWANGDTIVNRFGYLIGKGVFAVFADPAFFVPVSVGERGRSLLWQDEIDLCADTLWLETHPADAPQPPQSKADQRASYQVV